MSNNVIGTSGKAYDPYFYANEAIMQLEKALGMAARVHRGYDKDPQSPGSVIQIRKPQSFTAQDAPSAAQDLNPGETNITLNRWKEVKFKLTDKELTLTDTRIIEDHIRPAAYALADEIDQALNALHADIPWHYDYSGTPVVADITNPRKILFENRVPIHDPNMLHFELNGTVESDFLGLSAFTQHQGSGDAGVMAQLRGQIGQRYGINFFANQNVANHVKGTLSDTTPVVSGDHAAGATTLAMSDSTLTGTLKIGDTLVIAGNTQRYAVTTNATASGNAISVGITPALVQAYADTTAVTVTLTTHDSNLLFHSHAFALAMAPLSDMGNELGAKIATVTDPVSNLTLRSRLYYDGNNSAVHVALDVLYGIKTLDPNKAVRLRSNRS